MDQDQYNELSVDGMFEVREEPISITIRDLPPDLPPVPPQYSEWVGAKLAAGGDPFGMCAEWTEEMQAVFPELARVRGTVLLSNLWERDHWWLVTADGVVVDPTASQFAQPYYSGGATVLWYFCEEHGIMRLNQEQSEQALSAIRRRLVDGSAKLLYTYADGFVAQYEHIQVHVRWWGWEEPAFVWLYVLE